MPIADFIVTIHDADKPLGVRVVVHKNLAAMRSAVTQQDNKMRMLRKNKHKRYGKYSDTLGICQRSFMSNSHVYATVRLAPPHIGAAMVAHEMAHAAVGLWEIKHKFEPTPITSGAEHEEWFCWILGELVRRTHNQLWDKGVYTHENQRDSIGDG